MARVCLGRSLLFGLPERLQNSHANELRPVVRPIWSNPLQASCQLVVHLNKE